MLPVAILAGGLATRLGPLAQETPKALIEVAGRPFLAWQLEMLSREGVERVVLCLKHLGEMIRDFVGNGSAFGLNVTYSHDGEQPLGTGGALRKALPLLGEQFFVMYGDSYLTVDLKAVERAFHKEGSPALMVVLRNDNRWDKSNVWFDGRRIVAYRKRDPQPEMKYIDYGVGVLSAKLFDDPSLGDAFDLADLYERLAARRELGCYVATKRFYEIGSIEGLREANLVLGGKLK
jgi:NDP-sugar pyrophosphorylase family protein